MKVQQNRQNDTNEMQTVGGTGSDSGGGGGGMVTSGSCRTNEQNELAKTQPLYSIWMTSKLKSLPATAKLDIPDSKWWNKLKQHLLPSQQVR